MEHGAKECVEEQSRRETTIAIGVQSAAYIDTEITATNTKEEPGSMELVKSEAVLLVKEEVLEDSWEDMDRQPCVQATYKPAITTSVNVVAGGVVQGDALNMKEEWADTDMDVGPTVLQHMDAHYKPVQPDVSIIKQEGRSDDNNINPTRCSGVKVETIEDERRVTSPVVHTCEYCHKTYSSKSGLFYHTKVVHTKLRYRCSDCNKQFTCKLALQRHIRREHTKEEHEVSSPAVHSCEYCHKTYASNQTLVHHIDVVHTKLGYRCSKCNKEFKGKLNLQRHMKRVHSEELHEADTDDRRSNEQSKQRARSQLYTCDKCMKTYASKWSLLAHITSLHSTQSHKCTKCKKKFPSKAYLNKHTSSAHSEQQYECAVCKKIYGSKTALHYHGNHVHRPRPAGSEPHIYTCDCCKKMFTDKETMRRHIARVHSSGSYKCHQCKNIFKCMAYLMRHTGKVHAAKVHTAGSKPRIYTCDYCKKMFTDKETVRRHIGLVHSSGSYKCHQCKKIFKCKAYLMRHTGKVHTAKVLTADLRTQIYTCDYCPKTFYTKPGLQQHTKKIHIAAHIHRCRRCDMNFKSNDVLRRHNTCIHAQYKCEVCLRLYMRKASLRNHFNKAHNSKEIQFKSDLPLHEMPDSRPTADDMNAAPSTSAQQHNVDVVKEEPADAELELGPVVFQHMDCNYRPYEGEPQDGLGG